MALHGFAYIGLYRSMGLVKREEDEAHLVIKTMIFVNALE
jgi:hypothetical protein